MRRIAALILSLATWSVFAADVAGVTLAETIQSAGGAPLVLRGAGLRKRALLGQAQ